MIQAYIDSWRFGFTFSGRTRRRDYWYSLLVNFLVLLTLGIVLVFTSLISDFISVPYYLTLVILVLYILAYTIPGYAIMARRLHDQDKTGLLVLVNFVPYVGGLVTAVLMCIEGTQGPNRFGQDPKVINGGSDSVYVNN